MRVLWVVKGLGPGGAETLLAAAARLHDPELTIECAYVLPWKDHLAGALEAAGVRTVCVSRSRRDPLWPVRLARLVRGGQWDVVHVHSPLPAAVARLAVRSISRAARPALVTTEHNAWSTFRMPTRLLNRWTVRWDDAAIAVSDEARESMSGRALARATTLAHGIDVASVREARQQRDQIRTELGLTADEMVVGTVANFREQKDYPNLLAAMRALADRGIVARLVAVGQGPGEAEVRRLVAELRLADRVVLTGFRADATAVMSAADVFVLASRWEGLPVALMEALALGLPVVATAVGGVAEAMDDDIDALLVAPRDPDALADALQRVLT
ncbi:MAG TPA: glycosyltransferase, partial [Ilumatobacteraceae bacterium]